jgi:hypothetical protein
MAAKRASADDIFLVGYEFCRSNWLTRERFPELMMNGRVCFKCDRNLSEGFYLHAYRYMQLISCKTCAPVCAQDFFKTGQRPFEEEEQQQPQTSILP